MSELCKIMCVVGTRPEVIKMAPLVHKISQSSQFELRLVTTGQHKEMVGQAMELFQLKADIDLEVMKAGQTLTSITSRVLERLEPVMQAEQPSVVLVHGDTTTTLAASLAAFYQKVDIGHVEAGLRTYDKYAPYPEEMNRQLVSRLADWHFAPTELARQNLLAENIDAKSIQVTGNTAIDCLDLTLKQHYSHELLERMNGHEFILVTVHRRENLGVNMEHIFSALLDILDYFPNIHILFPVHKNPVVRELAEQMLQNHPRIHLSEPLNTVEFHNIAYRSILILTDSGGVQEEAPSLHKPVLVLRNQTERPEGVDAGVLKLVGTDRETIVQSVTALLTDERSYQQMASGINPYGDGQAAERIIRVLEEHYASAQAAGRE